MAIVGGAGVGSKPEYVQVLIDWLPKLVRKYRIKTVNDAGAGNQQWISKAKWKVYYRAYDIAPFSESVTPLDITQESMRPADLVICKDVFRHLSDENICKVLALLETKFILCDTEPGAPIESGPERPIDMIRFLGKPLETIESTEPTTRAYPWWTGKYFGFWKFP